MASKEEVFEKVKDALVDALGVDDDEVTAEATLVGDLGAESIDFLDIVFRLEKAFSIKIPKAEMFQENIVNNAEYVEEGKLNATGLEAIKKAMPHLDFSSFEQNPEVNRLTELFTVAAIVKYVKNKLKK